MAGVLRELLNGPWLHRAQALERAGGHAAQQHQVCVVFVFLFVFAFVFGVGLLNCNLCFDVFLFHGLPKYPLCFQPL